jgi:hypothetical protein
MKNEWKNIKKLIIEIFSIKITPNSLHYLELEKEIKVELNVWTYDSNLWAEMKILDLDLVCRD